MKRYGLPTILAALMVLPVLAASVFACTRGGEIGAADDSAAAGDEFANEKPSELQSPVFDADFGGAEIRILHYETASNPVLTPMNIAEEIGEVVNDAFYRRNRKVKEDLNVNFRFIEENGENLTKDKVAKSVMSGSDDYDMIVALQYECVPQVTNNLFANLTGAPYIDLERPWWPDAYIAEMTIGKGGLYFLTGDISLNFIKYMSCVYFNKQLYADYFGDPDAMYQTVLDGKWTLDKLGEISKGIYKDLNGNGEYDDGDQYAYGVIIYNLTDHFTYNAGVRATGRDGDGIPYFVMNSERTASYAEKLYGLFYENEGGRVFPPTAESTDINIPAKFAAGELLFDLGWFHVAERLRDMHTDYGIIPFPKYDESQPEYLSLAHDCVPVYCIPKTCQKTDEVSAALEAMAFETHRTAMPAYYEVALKLKYTRDSTEDAFKIIDMIHDNCTTDFAYIYNYALNGIGLIMRDLMGSKSYDFVSRYEKIEQKAQTGLDKLIETYMENAD